MENNIRKIFKIAEWNNQIESLGLFEKTKVENHFKIWLDQINTFTVSERNQIKESVRLFEDMLLFRTPDGRLHKFITKIKYNNLTIDDLYEFAKERAKLLWNREFTPKIIFVNSKWRVRLACYRIYKNSDKREIIFSRRINKLRTKEEVLLTLLHEMVHWHLETSGKPYKDTDMEFIKEIKRVGAVFSKSTAAQKALKIYEKGEKKHE